jgi:hypothetical protein
VPDQNQILYLFSSNIRPLYEQDILDLLAHPKGTLFRFRYFKRYVSPELTANPGAVVGMSALVHFSIQDPGQYHEPAFIPVRWAKICATEDVGDVLLLVLRLGAYCALERPIDFRKPEQCGAIVRKYFAALRGVPQPYNYSAGIGPLLSTDAPVDPSSDESHLFESLVQFLQGTQSFREARFYRVRGVTRLSRSGDVTERVLPDEHGVVQLRGGDTYTIQVHHFQKSEIEGTANFTIDVDDENIRVIGKPGFSIASRYDVMDVEMHAVEPPTSEARETVISIEPVEGVRGPTTKLRVRIARSSAKTAAAIGGAAMVAFFLGVPNLWPSLNQGWKTFFIVVATALTGILASVGLKR